MTNETLTISTPDGSFNALVRRPPGNAPGPAVVVIQEIFGVNHTMRQVADDLAAQGYIAVVPDLFWRFEPGIELDDHKPAELQRAFDLFPQFDVDKGVEDITATLSAVRGMAGCNGKVGAVGFCLGGLLAFLTATRTDADATVSYYGVNIDHFTKEAEKLAHPLLLHIAGNDQFVPPAAQEKIVTDLKNHPQVHIERYPGRDHAFARKAGDHYHAGDAAKADARTLAFLDANLKG
jgi:carboxymethylenebutenolidase